MSDLLLQDAHIPAAYTKACYRDYLVDEPYRVEALRQVCNWKPTTAEPNLLLWGKPGLGKTFLAVASLNERQWRWEFRTKSGTLLPNESVKVLRQNKLPVYFIQLAELINLHIRSFNMDKETQEYIDLANLLNDLAVRAKWLVVDDVGKEHSTASNFSIDTFDALVRSRFNSGLNTIFTSNLPLSRWESCYSESMRNFIERTSRVVKFA